MVLCPPVRITYSVDEAFTLYARVLSLFAYKISHQVPGELGTPLFLSIIPPLLIWKLAALAPEAAIESTFAYEV
jgi:hypothetical protein